MDEKAERLVVQMAKENPGWGYDRIVGALANLGFLLSYQTVGNILRRHGLSPAPKRKQVIRWKDFIRSHTTNYLTIRDGAALCRMFNRAASYRWRQHCRGLYQTPTAA